MGLSHFPPAKPRGEGKIYDNSKRLAISARWGEAL